MCQIKKPVFWYAIPPISCVNVDLNSVEFLFFLCGCEEHRCCFIKYTRWQTLRLFRKKKKTMRTWANSSC